MSSKRRARSKSGRWQKKYRVLRVEVLEDRRLLAAADGLGDWLPAAREIPAVPETLLSADLVSTPEAEASSFPFTIADGTFLRDGEPVFLNIIGYSPYEPGQGVSDSVRERRIGDDLRRLGQFRDASDPVVLRVYPRSMPAMFYDGVRELGFWIIRDIFVPEDIDSPSALEDAKGAVNAVIDEVANAGALDRIFAWEIANEFELVKDYQRLETYLGRIRDHIKTRLSEPPFAGLSSWVAWAPHPGKDLLRTDGARVSVRMDYYSINAYPYDPELVRDHQPGPVTGRPFSGYLKALAEAVEEEFPGSPLVVSETGLPGSPTPVSDVQQLLHPWYPQYRKGGLTSQQVAEGLVDLIMDARLPGLVDGIGLFEWNDEWHKTKSETGHGNPGIQDGPEEYYGVGGFTQTLGQETYDLRCKFQYEVVRDLFTLDFDGSATIVTGLAADDTSLSLGEKTTVRATVEPGAIAPVRFRWESSRGRIVGDSDTVEFYTGDLYLGPAEVTVVAIDGAGNVHTESIVIDIQSPGDSTIEILTLGEDPGTDDNQRAVVSGRVANIDLNSHKVVIYVQTDRLYVAPYEDAPFVFVGPGGYWWSTVNNDHEGELVAWVVPRDYEAIDRDRGYVPSGKQAEDRLATANDTDNNRLDDNWERGYFDALGANPYGDPDGDLAYNVEEFLTSTTPQFADGMDPTQKDNDTDADGLADNWERRYFRTLAYGAADDPDGDKLVNSVEYAEVGNGPDGPRLGTHPGRTSLDLDKDDLPDNWERRLIGDLSLGPLDDPDGDGFGNLSAYQLAISPLRQTPWQSPFNYLDVNIDGGLSPLDVLALVDDINRNGSRPLPVPPVEPNVPPLYLDPSGNNAISSLDVLMLIDDINRNGSRPLPVPLVGPDDPPWIIPEGEAADTARHTLAFVELENTSTPSDGSGGALCERVAMK